MKTETGVVNMINIDAGEAIHLFKVMQRHGVKCGLEVKVENADPFVSFSGADVKSEYIEGRYGDTVVVYLDAAEFGFPLGEYKFAKHISDCQIDVLVVSEHLAAWFSSDALSPEAIAEANGYDPHGGEFDDKEICLDHSDTSTSFHEQLSYFHSLLEMGAIIKKVEVSNAGATQVITVGWYDGHDTESN